jgi:site-specific recombinase XerD
MDSKMIYQQNLQKFRIAVIVLQAPSNRLADTRGLMPKVLAMVGNLRLLKSYLKAVRPFLLSQADEPALFLNHAGQRMPYHTFRRIVHRSAEAAGLEINVTPHTFGRSCTTELVRGGANLYHVKELLGHENLETLKHYTKLTIEDLKATHARCHPREQAGDR